MGTIDEVGSKAIMQAQQQKRKGTSGTALLFKGKDFLHTDVAPALCQ